MFDLVVFNPVARTVTQHVPRARPLTDLGRARVGLYWNLKAGGDIAIDRVAERLRERHPKIELSFFRGSLGPRSKHMTPEDVQRIAAVTDAVIGTTAD